MKWFKHDSDAYTDTKLKKLRHKYGIVGYGLYWYCLELIARNVVIGKITFELEDDAQTIAIDWNLDQVKVQEMMEYMIELKLFESSDGLITCRKMSKRLDDTTTRNPEMKKLKARIKLKNPEDSSENPEDSSGRSDKTRLDNNKILRLIGKGKLSKDSVLDITTSNYIFFKILELNPEHKDPDIDEWADDVRLMRESDGRSHNEIKELFEYANDHNFWKKNILSPMNLRKHWDKLLIEKENETTNIH